MRSRFKRFILAAMILLILGSSGCAAWLQSAPPEPVRSYRGLNENSIITTPY